MVQSKKTTKRSPLAIARADKKRMKQELDATYEAIDIVRGLLRAERQTTEKLQDNLNDSQQECKKHQNEVSLLQVQVQNLKYKIGKFEEVREMYYHKLVALSGEAASFAAVASDFRDYWRKEVKLE